MRLPEQEAGRFIALYSGLIGWCAGRLDATAKVRDLQSFLDVQMEDKAEARDRMLDHPKVIDEFLAENPYDLGPDDLALIAAWRTFVRDNLVIERDLKKHTVFVEWIDEPVAYAVLSLTDEIVDLVPSPLPIVVEAVLLPWKGAIVCDGMVRYRTHLAPGIRRRAHDAYKVAKERGIVTTLGPAPEPAPATTNASRRKPSKPTNRRMTSSRLKGEPRIRADHLDGLPGLRRAAVRALVERQPKTVAEALDIPDVGRQATGRLLERGVIADPDGVQARALRPRFRREAMERQASSSAKPAFVGRWRIIAMDPFDEDYFEMDGPAYVEVEARGSGRFRFGLVSGEMDCRFTLVNGQPLMEFSWEGNDEHHPETGRGRAVVDPDGTMRGRRRGDRGRATSRGSPATAPAPRGPWCSRRGRGTRARRC